MKLKINPSLKGALDARIFVKGAKNALLPLLFALPMIKGKSHFSNVPLQLEDYLGSRLILSTLGLKFEEAINAVSIQNQGLSAGIHLPSALTGATRCSLYLLGSLAKQQGSVTIGLPGGCSFGVARQFNLHLEGLRALNAKVSVKGDEITLEHKTDCNAHHKLPFPSVGATTNLILYAALGNATVTLSNCAVEPEIINLIDFLNQCGANINVDVVKRVIHIQGVSGLVGSQVRLIPDRIQTMTYVALAMMHRKKLYLEGVSTLDSLNLPLNLLVDAGLNYDYCSAQQLLTVHGDQLNGFSGVEAICQPYPGFPTDLQPIFSALGLCAETRTVIQDQVIPERTAYLDELKKMGANVQYDGQEIIINPQDKILQGSMMKSTDLRAGMACVMAASIAKGSSVITNAGQVYRGYNDLLENLSWFMDVERYELKHMKPDTETLVDKIQVA